MFGLCLVGGATAPTFEAQEAPIEASAETTTSATMEWRGDHDGVSKYFYIHFAGFTTQEDYKGNANSDYVFQHVKFNGKTIYDINAETDVTGWAWESFPQREEDGMPYHQKPVLGLIKDAKGRIQFRVHNNTYNEIMKRDGFFLVTLCEGFTINGYVLDKETTYRVTLNAELTYGGTMENAARTPTFDWRTDQFDAATYYGYINFSGFKRQDNYEGLANDDYIFQNILLNGTSIYEWNQTVDVSDWWWASFPQVNYSPIAQFRKPVMGYIKDTNGRIQLRVHKEMIGMLLARDGYVRLTVKKGMIANNYIVGEEVSADVITAQEAAPITVTNAVSYPNSSYMKYVYVNFEGFTTKDDYNGAAKDEYVFRNVRINGKSLYDINAETDVTGWIWEIYPQTTGEAQYCKAILGFMEEAGKLQLRIHKNYFEAIMMRDGKIEVSVDSGFHWNGYVNKTECKAVVAEGAFLDESDIFVTRWQPNDSAKLIYFDIACEKLVSNFAYGMMDNAAYKHFMDMIAINGVTLASINANTDVSGWEWNVFPSSHDDRYKKPVLGFGGATESYGTEGHLELRLHYNYFDAIKQNGFQLSILPGMYPGVDGKTYIIQEEIVFVKDPAQNSATNEGGFVEAATQSNFQMKEGASVRLTSDSTGIRFTAKIAKSYLERLEAEGVAYRLMMQINREGSSKTAYVEGENYYEENGFIVYNVAVVNLKEASYSLEYTARPYVEITEGGETRKVYTQTVLQTRTINDVAYSAYTDFSDSYDEKEYPYEVLWEGEVKYSPYTAEQRDILASFVTDAVLLEDGVYKFVNEADKTFVMLSDNAQVNAFFSEYADRFVYYYKNFEEADDYVTDTVVGNASMSWKDWEAESILFMDTIDLNGNDDQFRGDIQEAKVDKYGYVWEGDSYFGQGWSMPTYIGSRATTDDPFLSDGWEFVNGRKNSAILDLDPGAGGTWGACEADWAATGDGSFASATDSTRNDGAGYYLGHATNSTYVTFYLESRAGNGVLQAAHSPFLDIGLDWSILEGSIREIYLEFRVGNGQYVSLPLSQWATTEIDFSKSNNSLHLYVPMFEHSAWTGTVTGLRLKITGNFSAYCYLDYVRGAYDTRMIDSNTSFISAGKQHFENTGDLDFLQANINNYRKALMFLTNYMADNGLINLSNFIGHNGSAQGFATSLISTYWDIISLAPNSSYVNALYYKALCNVAYLEDALTANRLTVAAPSVKTTMTGASVTYSYTAAQLRNMAASVKTAVSAELNEGTKTGYFKTFDVQLNGKTVTAGRFIEGYYGNTQIDFGAVALNLMILESGVASEAQKEMVLNWIASIDDLYDYVFAPKTNTEDVEDQYCWGYAAAKYGVSCQNGGAILFVSYYDILARAQVYGANDAFARLTEIMEWFADVTAAYEASGRTNPKEFFLPYYETHDGTLQGRNEEGALGLHAEFVENAILYAVVPNAFFGFDTYYGADGLVMQIAPNLPDAVGNWKMEGVRYAGLSCDVAVANNFVVVCNVEELADGAADRNTKLAITLSYEGETPKVYVNNKLVSEGYTVDRVNKTVTVTVNFGNVNVSVR